MGIQRLAEGNSFGVVCPFCGDARGKMNFRIMKNGEPANTYHCFCCGASGNMLTLYAEIKGLQGANRFKQAYREIRDSLEGHHKYLLPSLKQGLSASQEDPQSTPEQKDLVYRRMLELLSLSNVHRDHLLARGFTEKEIGTFGFRSTPLSGTETLARKLIREGYSLSGIPGFFVNHHRNWDAAFFRKTRGFLCPAYDLDGRISGFQIRLDEPYDGRKYIWLSSTNRNRGTGSRSPITFLGNPKSKIIGVTEGILKAEAAYAMSGCSFLGIPGVNQYREMEKALQVLKENGLQEVREYYDMDKFCDIHCNQNYKPEICTSCTNRKLKSAKTCPYKERKREQIRDGCRRLYEICGSLGISCTRQVWELNQEGVWNGQNKGIDDHWLSVGMRQRRAHMNEYYGTAAA